MQVKVNWQGDMSFQGQTESGQGIKMTIDPSIGPKPTELLLSAIGGCSGVDVVSILNKMRVPFFTLEMIIDGERNAEDPKYFTKIHAHYILTGENLEPQKVARAIDLSLNKYCSVSQSLRSEISASYEVNGERFELDSTSS